MCIFTSCPIFNFILFYFILFYFILFYFILFYFILFYFILFYFILFYYFFYFLFFFWDAGSKLPKRKGWLRTQPRFVWQFRPVLAGFYCLVLKSGNCPEPDGTAGQPTVGFWSRPSVASRCRIWRGGKGAVVPFFILFVWCVDVHQSFQ